MHDWGDDTVDWRGISDAAEYIGLRLKRLGRVSVRDYKEKYGTVRVYCSLGWDCLLNITHPGYVHYRPYPSWLMHLDIYYSRRLMQLLNVIVVPYHKWLYRDTYCRAVLRWPHLKEEILCGADYDELLEDLQSDLSPRDRGGLE